MQDDDGIGVLNKLIFDEVDKLMISCEHVVLSSPNLRGPEAN